MVFEEMSNEQDLVPVPNWMRCHPLYPVSNVREVKAYPAGIHDGTVNIPGLTKGSRIVSTKVPPLFSPEHDTTESYTILDWCEEIKNWCIICEVEPARMGKLVVLAIDGTAKIISEFVSDHVTMYGQVQDWNDGNGPLHRTGVEIVLKTALALYPPNPQVIQIKAIQAWDNFRRRPDENTMSMLARLKIVLYLSLIHI